MGTSVQAVASVTGAKAQNIEFLAVDYAPTDVGTIRINFALDGAIDVEITKNSGTSWQVLIAATIDELDTKFTTGVRAGDLVNFRTTDAAGTTLRYFRVDFTTEDIS